MWEWVKGNTGKGWWDVILKEEIESNNNNLQCFAVSAPLVSICPRNAEQALFCYTVPRYTNKGRDKNHERAETDTESSYSSSSTCPLAPSKKGGSSFGCFASVKGAMSVSIGSLYA